MARSKQTSRDLRRRLERLERRKPPARRSPRKPPVAPADLSAAVVGLPPGDELSNTHGSTFRIEKQYAVDHLHGSSALSELFGFESALAAEVAGDASLRSTDPRQWAFLDLETTGLAGGAGTLGFLVGIGAFTKDGFRLRQYFLRDPAEEPAMLEALREDLKQAAGMVSFNGRAFDLPLLETRYTVALRDRWRLTRFPHLDLLYPSRRLWSSSLANCRLSTIEQQVLGIERTEQDVSGALIPGMYLDYLRTGDASEMTRVIYHNAIDILSLVGLASQVLHRHAVERPDSLSSGEALAVARWHQGAGRIEHADAAFQAAVEGDPEPQQRREALRWYTAHLKRDNRREEALAGWEQWHSLDPTDPFPCIELAMYYEWHARQLQPALDWSHRARQAIESWPKGWRREQSLEDIDHRIARLQQKLEG